MRAHSFAALIYEYFLCHKAPVGMANSLAAMLWNQVFILFLIFCSVFLFLIPRAPERTDTYLNIPNNDNTLSDFF
jgi:hypothetical protein